jgi:hypothetical protein
MDLTTALNLGNKYRDYRDTETRDHDLNRNVMDRIFDVGPMVATRRTSSDQPPVGILPLPVLTPVDQYLCQPTKSEFSQQYLQMKQAQEYETLLQNPAVNQVAIEQLKQKQFEETKWLANQIQTQNSNKYKNIKPSQTRVNVPQKHVAIPQSDVYQQTSYGSKIMPIINQSILNQQLKHRQQQILTRKSPQGIQSYQSEQFGTTLQEAYIS